MKKQILALLLACLLVISLLAGCSKTQTAAEPAPADESGAAPAEESAPADEAAPIEEAAPADEAAPVEEAAPSQEAAQPSFPLFDEPTTFTIWTSSSPDLSDIVDDFNDYTVISQMEELTNLHWEATIVSFTAQTELFQLMVAAQDYDDVCNGADSYNGGTDQAVEDEFIINLRDLVDENMPNLCAKFDAYPELEKALLTLEGNLCYFPKIYTQPSMSTSGWTVRMDWLEELGIEAPKTYDDLYAMLTAFKVDKGADSALIVPPSGVPSGNALIGGYGIGAGYYVVDGEVRYGQAQPEYKEFISMMNKWYSEGLIWSEFYTQDTDRLMDFSTILSDNTGMWHGGVQDMSTLALQATDPNFKLGGIAEVTVDGKESHFGEAPTMLDMNSWAITTACLDPVSVCKYVDYLYSDEGVLLANYGVEGETFVYDEEGTPHLTELVTNNPEFEYRIALNIFTCDRQTPVPYVIDQTKSLETYDAQQLQAMDAWATNLDYAYAMPSRGLNFTMEESNEITNLGTDMDTYIEENIAKFIIGAKPMSEFDAFVEGLYSFNLDRLVEIQQTAYERYLAN